MNQKLGYALLIASFLGGAFTASLDAVEMDWPFYLLAIAVGIAGTWIIKSSASRDAQAEHVLEGNRAVLVHCLDSIIMNLGDTNTNREDIPTYEMRFEIDRLFRIDLMAFADARESLIHIYSLQDYADIMSHFAAGERYINRVWSASADGYVDEVTIYLERALGQFIDAKARLDQAQAALTARSAQVIAA